jgi:cold shock CspA family protein
MSGSNGRLTGVVKKWDRDRGFGFISRPGDTDIFAHISDWRSVGPPKVGDRVSFELGENPDAGKVRAKAVMRSFGE